MAILLNGACVGTYNNEPVYLEKLISANKYRLVQNDNVFSFKKLSSKKFIIGTYYTKKELLKLLND